MKKLHLLILRSFIGPFFLIFFIVLFVLLVQFLWRYIDELVGKGLDTKTIAELMLYISASLVPMALPLSILMASLMTFGNLGERYELTAIKASGISLQRIMRPLVLVVLILSIGDFFFANNVLPYANLQMRSLMYDIRQQRPELQIKPGEFNSLIDGYSIRVKNKDPKTNVLYGLTIYDHSSGHGNTSVTLADSGTMLVTANDKHLIITLYNGHSYNELYDSKKPQKMQSYPHRYDKFKEQQIIIELKGFGLQRTDQSLFKSHYSMLNLKQLRYYIDSLSLEIDERNNQFYQSLHNDYFKMRNPRSKRSEREPDALIIPQAERNAIGGNRLQQKKQALDSLAKHAKKPERIDSPDSIIAEVSIPVILFDTDSLFNTFTLQEKSRITSAALSAARTTKNLVANSHQTLEFKFENLRRYEVEWQRKFTVSIACLLFMFIGAPLGAIIRKGGLGLPMVISVVFFILYYVLSLIGEKLVRSSVWTDEQGMWATSVLFAVIGAFITYKATTDSSIFNLDTYSNFIKKVFGQRYNVVDMVHIDVMDDTIRTEAKTENMYSSLFSLNDSIEQLLETHKFNMPDIIIDMFSPQNDSELVIFERLYYNTFASIINSSVFHNKSIRAKIYEFPAMNISEFQDPIARQYGLIILACLPPFTLFVAARHIIKLIVLRSKLKQIKRLIPELGTSLKINT